MEISVKYFYVFYRDCVALCEMIERYFNRLIMPTIKPIAATVALMTAN